MFDPADFTYKNTTESQYRLHITHDILCQIKGIFSIFYTLI